MDLPVKTSKAEALYKLWEEGVLYWKLDATQKQMYDLFQSNPNKITVFLCSRRLGKSWALCLLALEQCYKVPNSVVKYVTSDAKMARNIIKPLIRDLVADCPKKLRPAFHTHESVWRFHNGSEIQLAGADAGRIESLRGGNSHICIVDEAGFISDLKYCINSILLPTTLTTKGKIILSSTPPANSGHEFIDYVNTAKYKGGFIHKTIFDNVRLTNQDIQGIVEECGGMASVEFRREFLAEIITDTTKAVIPEFNEELEKEIVSEWQKPSYYDSYIGMDLGMKDFTAVLFAYYDFKAGKLIIEDEIVMNGPTFTTERLAVEIKNKEAELWTAPNGNFKPPFLRVSDVNLIVINDLYQLYNLLFIPTAKDDSDAALNHVRMLLASKKIIISPKCKTLIFHLKNVTWTKSRKTYERSPDGGHYDTVDALKYLVRNVNFTKNPYPPGYDYPSGDLFQNDQNGGNLNPFMKLVKNLYGRKINKL